MKELHLNGIILSFIKFALGTNVYEVGELLFPQAANSTSISSGGWELEGRRKERPLVPGLGLLICFFPNELSLPAA